jgi:secondary thiamine-phosphate synthase enzyme
MSQPRLEITKKTVGRQTIVVTAYLIFNTRKRYELVRITEILQEIVEKSGIREGLCFVAPMHITSSVFVNDDEAGLHADFLEWLEKLAPYNPKGYRHNLTGEDNADAHLKRTIMGRETILAITDGKLDLGPWEEVFYGEFDGQRPKRVVVKIIGTSKE